MSWFPTAVTRQRRKWTVEVQSDSGETGELSYASEAQARYFAAVLSLGPQRLPVPVKIRQKLQALGSTPAGAVARPTRSG
jgi:hypothetical protein